MSTKTNGQLAADLIRAGGEIATRIIDAMAAEHPAEITAVRQALEQGDALVLSLTLGPEPRIELDARNDYGNRRRIGALSLPNLPAGREH